MTELVHLAVDGIRVTTPDIDARRAVAAVATAVQNDGIDTRQVDPEDGLQINGETVKRAARASTTTTGSSARPARQRRRWPPARLQAV